MVYDKVKLVVQINSSEDNRFHFFQSTFSKTPVIIFNLLGIVKH